MIKYPLYIIRRPLTEIHSAMCPVIDDIEIVFLERALSDSSVTGEFGGPTGSRRVITHDDIVQKLFEWDRAIVI